MQAAPSPVVELNRAVAVAMRDGAQAGLALLEAILERGELARLPPASTPRAASCAAGSDATTTPVPPISRPSR